MKKLTAIILALALVLSFGVMANAADPLPTTGTITVKNVSANTDLNLYKLLTASVTDGNTYTYDYTDANYAQVFIDTINAYVVAHPTLPALAASPSASEVFLYITNNLKNDSAFAKALGEAFKAYFITNSTDATYTADANGTYNNTQLNFTVGVGYYLILDVTSYETNNSTTNPNVLNVMIANANPNAEVTLKSQTYTVPVKEITTSTILSNGNSVNIGDVIDYKITVQVPNYSTYTSKSLVIKDLMSAGLTFNTGSLAVKVGNATAGYTDIASSTYTLDTTTQNGFILTWADITSTFAGQIGNDIIVTYTATVDDDAAPTNTNGSSVIENGYTIDGNGTTVKSYGFDINKINEYEEKLDNVKFKLYTTDGTTKTYLKFTAADTDDVTGVDTYLYDSVNGIDTLKTINGGQLIVFGLEAGTYYLEEIEALPGYNNLTAPIEIVLPGEVTSFTVTNYTGIQLPSTGGIGTTIFTVIGTMMILSAGAFLALNKKKVFSK